MDELTHVYPWATFCEAAHHHELKELPDRQGRPVSWAYLLPPSASAILFAEHFWEGINAKLGTLLDRAEEEELGPEVSAKIAEEALAVARSRYRDGIVKKEVGRRADGSPLYAEIEAAA